MKTDSFKTSEFKVAEQNGKRMLNVEGMSFGDRRREGTEILFRQSRQTWVCLISN